MVSPGIIIAVEDVAASAQWYQALFACQGAHGGNTFEVLTNDAGEVMLYLHKWGEHGHPSMKDPAIPHGNGLILYFQVDALGPFWKRANALKAKVDAPPHLNENSHRQEFSVWDPNGYYLTITEKW